MIHKSLFPTVPQQFDPLPLDVGVTVANGKFEPMAVTNWMQASLGQVWGKWTPKIRSIHRHRIYISLAIAQLTVTPWHQLSGPLNNQQASVQCSRSSGLRGGMWCIQLSRDMTWIHETRLFRIKGSSCTQKIMKIRKETTEQCRGLLVE